MTTQLVHGFKTLAERQANSVREALGLSPTDKLDSRKLADHLGVLVVSVKDLRADGASEESISRLLADDAGFSALTVCVGDNRVIVHNPEHASTRQNNSLAHELSHVILEHSPSPAAFESGCRAWNGREEMEADWLAGCLLVPREGALKWMASGGTVASGARQFGVSQALFTWRLNQTGIMYQLKARKRR